MSATATKEAIKPTGSSNDDEMFHLYCCDEDKALCGVDLTDVPETSGEDELECVVCADLDEFLCPECGDGPE